MPQTPSEVQLSDGTYVNIAGMPLAQAKAVVAAAETAALQRMQTQADATSRPAVPAYKFSPEQKAMLAQGEMDATVSRRMPGLMESVSPQINPLEIGKALLNLLNPDPSKNTLVQGVVQPAKLGWQALGDFKGAIDAPWDQKLNYALRGVQHAAGSIPLIGPSINAAGDAMLEGDTDRAMGMTAGNILTPAIQHALGGPIKSGAQKVAAAVSPRLAEVGFGRTSAMKEDFPASVRDAVSPDTRIWRRGQINPGMDAAQGQIDAALARASRGRGSAAGLLSPAPPTRTVSTRTPLANPVNIDTAPHAVEAPVLDNRPGIVETIQTPRLPWDFEGAGTQAFLDPFNPPRTLGVGTRDFLDSNPTMSHVPNRLRPEAPNVTQMRNLSEGAPRAGASFDAPSAPPAPASSYRIVQEASPIYGGEAPSAPHSRSGGGVWLRDEQIPITEAPPATPINTIPGMTAPRDIARGGADYAIREGKLNFQGDTRQASLDTVRALSDQFQQNWPQGLSPTDLDQMRQALQKQTAPLFGRDVNDPTQLFRKGTAVAAREMEGWQAPETLDHLRRQQSLMGLDQAFDHAANTSKLPGVVQALLAGGAGAAGFHAGFPIASITGATIGAAAHNPGLMLPVANMFDLGVRHAPSVARVAGLFGKAASPLQQRGDQ